MFKEISFAKKYILRKKKYMKVWEAYVKVFHPQLRMYSLFSIFWASNPIWCADINFCNIDKQKCCIFMHALATTDA
jgi:hypothetical protein